MPPAPSALVSAPVVDADAPPAPVPVAVVLPLVAVDVAESPLLVEVALSVLVVLSVLLA